MTGSQSLLLVLIVVAVSIAGAIVVGNWQRTRLAARRAEKRGWRFTIPRWQEFFTPKFQLVGSTKVGTVWELRRTREKKQLIYRWQAFSVPLPYGSVSILPAKSRLQPENEALPLLKATVPLDGWPAAYQLYTTHSQLANFFADDQVVTIMGQIPYPPRRGSLVSLNWEGRTLRIVCTFEEGWEILERMVALGEAIARKAYSTHKASRGLERYGKRTDPDDLD